MARRRRVKQVEWLIAQIDEKLEAFGHDRSGLDLRSKVKRLVDVLETTKDLGISVIAENGWDARAARDRIRLYLVEYSGLVIDRLELEVVAGISDYGRRIRELRVEQGYQIASGASPDEESGIELRPDEYLLVQPEPDGDAARRWHIANRVRRSGGGSQDRIRRYLLENVGRVVTTDELSYVSRDAKEFGRRTRELRTEQGYAIATRFTGRPDLAAGQYVLQSAERIAEPHDRRIPDAVQRQVYTRDDNRCRLCGWSHDSWRPDDPRILELHHVEQHREGGANRADNLIVLCSRCHDDLHAGRTELPYRFKIE
jgi:hypothetical protein